MRKRRAFLLVMVLFLVVILATMGFGFLGSRVGQYRSTSQALLTAQARALARAGIEDARAKLNKDLNFPPPMGANENYFTYLENFKDSQGKYLGAYKVYLDLTYHSGIFVGQNNIDYISITSVGGAGGSQPGDPPTAVHAYRAYVDLLPSSPTYFQLVRFDDLGSPTWGAVSGGGP